MFRFGIIYLICMLELVNKLERIVKTFPDEALLNTLNSINRGLTISRFMQKPEVGKFIADLEKDSKYDLFHGTMQSIGPQASSFEHDNVAAWLIIRSKEVGAEAAIDNLNNYVEADTFTAYEVALLTGLSVPRTEDIGNDVSIIPINEIPISQLHKMISRMRHTPLFTFDGPSAILLKPFAHERIHYNPEIKGESPLRSGPVEEIKDAHLCLSTIGPNGAQIIAHSTVAGDETPNPLSVGWSLPGYRSRSHPKWLNQKDLSDLKTLHMSFLDLEDSLQANLRVSMERLNNYAASGDQVDKAIELGIALESLFLDDNTRDELRFQFSLRASLLLGRTTVE